jgi:SAM-dependent methyltransferase
VTGVSQTTAAWVDDSYVASWAAADGLAGLLELPWRMASLLVGLDRQPDLIIDVGSGPGTFLARLLALYPASRGVWVDASPAMLERARATMAPFAERVSYVVGDMTDLADLDLPAGAGVITNSRVAHHLSATELAAFYRAGTELLAPGGWLVTLDHIRPEPSWDERLRAVLPAFAGPSAGKPTHPHVHPYPTMEDHVTGMSRAGLREIDVPWRAFYTCLVLGRRP